MSLNEFDMEKARAMRENVKGLFIKKLRTEFLATAVVSAVLMVPLVYASSQWALLRSSFDSPDRGLFYAMLYLFGLLFMGMLWGSYSTSSRLLMILKEVKQLRLDLLAAHDTPPENATGGAESFAPNWPIMAIRRKSIILLLVGVFVVVPAVAAIVYARIDSHRRTHWAEYESFGGQEMLNIHITPDGLARAFSRISVTKCPSLVAQMPIHIAQPNATLESVIIDGRPVAYDPVTGNQNTYNIMPGLPEKALKNAAIEVVWSFPVEDVEGRIQLRGVIPVNSYAVNAIIDTNAPYKFTRHPDKKTLNLYWTKRSDGAYSAHNLGTCGTGLEPLEQ